MDINRLKKLVKNRPRQWREGQAYFNYAYRMEPDKVDCVRGTNLDPFYNDNNIKSFIEYLTK